ncbi:MAG TPA: hypothetical protein VNM67_25970 [Thermoanaerobaculia bacterium]|jgi:hypothetical protein|nr:hypothetical protein [Thermoanaerobaculia bacterium]
MEMQDLDHVRFVTRHFRDLQGFRRLVPLGLLALSGAGLISRTSWPLSAALTVGACLLLFTAERYYRNHFGEAEPLEAEAIGELSPSILTSGGPAQRFQPAIPTAPRVVLIGGLACSVFILFQLLLWPPWVTIDSEVVYWSGDPAMTRAMLIQMLYGLCGLFFLGTWRLREQRLSQIHCLGIGLLLSGLAALAPWLAPGAIHFGVALLVCGSSLMLAGLLDHLQLVQVLGCQEEE